MALKCIVVDDEPLQQDILKDYIAEMHEFELVGVFDNGLDVLSYLKDHAIDLVFLDINIPGINGVDLVKRLVNPPHVIFTTAYPEYAVEGFNLDAVDYLLKPVSFTRFQKAIEKYQMKLQPVKQEEAESLLVKSGKKEYRIKVKNIDYIESMGDYVRIVAENQSLITHGTLNSYLEFLTQGRYFRIHKSFIVNLDKVEFFEGNCLSVRSRKFPIGRSYKEDFLRLWRGKNNPIE